ncbi:MAG: glycosyltransferase family 39 protein [Anaerolineae bacterium]|jgi:4-amino-4-deoxy-L-arabinose transferase-like glycosyltransferase
MSDRSRKWAFAVLLILLTWGLRLWWLEDVPPGWRDDELINIHALSGQLLNGEFPLYHLGASGHEPLYHYMHAGVHAVLGYNVLSGHILSIAFGTLSVALTYSLVRRLFPERRAAAAVASLALAISFWSLMYSRTAIRHISLPPFVLATMYVFWRQIEAPESTFRGWIWVGLLLGMALYTYTASRVLPLLLTAFGGYLGLFHPRRLRNGWRGMVLALVVMTLLVAPLGVAILQGRSARAIGGIGADARVTELATPVRALRGGDPVPLLTHTARTLAMFHARGDPEWLYNVPDRPVFDLFGAALLWAGVALCLIHWRQPRFLLLLLWLGLGLSPACISTPAASLSHTILAQPVVYVLPALALAELCRWLRRRGIAPLVCALLVLTFLLANGMRDVRDYFLVWSERGMVRLLYRADQREVADYLDAHPEITDVAVGSALMGPWDRIALRVDTARDDVAPRLFDPQRALVWAEGGGDSQAAVVIITSWPDPEWPISDLLAWGTPDGGAPGATLNPMEAPHLTLHMTAPISEVLGAPGSVISKTQFANGLALAGARWLDEDDRVLGREAVLLTWWHVAAPLDLPPMPIVAHPPPPATYSGPRLAVSAHLLDGSRQVVATDDGLWVDPLTLQPGDRFVQVHRFALPEGPFDGPYGIEMGLYDPMTGVRWPALETARSANLVCAPGGLVVGPAPARVSAMAR